MLKLLYPQGFPADPSQSRYQNLWVQTSSPTKDLGAKGKPTDFRAIDLHWTSGDFSGMQLCSSQPGAYLCNNNVRSQAIKKSTIALSCLRSIACDYRKAVSGGMRWGLLQRGLTILSQAR